MSSWVERNGISLQLLGGLIVTLVTLTAYAFTTFQTKDDYKGSMENLEKRLDRMETKIDDLLRR